MYLINLFLYSLIYYSHIFSYKFILNNKNLINLKSKNFPLVKIDYNYKIFPHFKNNKCNCKKCIKKYNLIY